MKDFKLFTVFIFPSVLLKKMISVFLVSALLFGGFIPKNQEFKDNFISALNCVANTIETNFYDQYSKVVMSSIKYISNIANIKTLAEIQLVKQQTQKKDNKTQVPVNTSADAGIIIQNDTNNQNEILKINLYGITNEIYNLCESIKINSNRGVLNIGILLFILFSILIVKIKDTVEMLLNNKYRKVKPAWLK